MLQVVVKEAWKPEVVSPETAETRKLSQTRRDTPHPKDKVPYGGSYRPTVKREGKLYHAAERAGLFIMYQTPAGTPDTDQGWVYGTVSTEGKVTSAGRVASCIECHQQAPHGRLFGYQGAGDQERP